MVDILLFLVNHRRDQSVLPVSSTKNIWPTVFSYIRTIPAVILAGGFNKGWDTKWSPSYLPPGSEELGLRFSGKQPRKYLRRTTMFFCPNPLWPLSPGLLGCRSTTHPAQVFGAPGSLPEVASLTHLITVISILEVRIRQKAGCSVESWSALASQRTPPRRHISTQSNLTVSILIHC